MDDVILMQNQCENIRLLRRYYRLSQKEFIEEFLMVEGKPMMSIATLSNLESKGGKRISEVVNAVVEKLGTDQTFFSMKPERFVERMEEYFPKSLNEEVPEDEAVKKSNINKLIDRMTLYFADQILDGSLKKGDKIDSDRILATKFNVGRSAVREALKILNVLGMIDIRPGQGSFISNSESNFFMIPLSWSFFLNSTQTMEIIDTRIAIEGKAAALAARCKDQDKLAELAEILVRMRKAYLANDLEAFLDSDREFHGCVARCSGNSTFVTLLQTIENLMRKLSKSGMEENEQLDIIYTEHQDIYGYILTGNEDSAYKSMVRHLEKSKDRYDIIDR